MEKMRGNGYKLLLGRLDARGQLFTARAISHWKNLPRKAVDSPTLDTSQISWTRCWAVLSRPGFCQGRLDQVILEMPSKLLFFVSIKVCYCCTLQVANSSFIINHNF